MAWGKADSTTLTGSADAITASSISNSNTYVYLYYGIPTGGELTEYLTMGSGGTKDTGSNYSNRLNTNGASSDSEFFSRANIVNASKSGATKPEFGIGYGVNLAAEEKLIMTYHSNVSSAGAGTAPDRNEVVGKHKQVSAVLDTISFDNTGSGDLATDSTLCVLGSDLTPVSAVPAIDNVQDNSLFVDKVNANRYWFDAGTDSTSINWNGADDCDVTATSIKKKSSAGNDWDVKAYTTEKCFSGGTITTTFKSNEISSSNTGWWVSFGTDAPSTGYGSDPAWFLRSDGKAGITTSDGNEEGSGHTITTSSVLKMVYTFGTGASTGECKWYIDDVLKHTESSITNPAHKTLNFSSYIADKGVNTLTLTVIGQDTWTMQPTYETDFSSSTGWTFKDSAKASISGGTLSFNFEDNSGDDDSCYYDLGSTMSDTKWLLRFKINWSTFDGNSRCWFGLASNTTAQNVAKDFIGLLTHKYLSNVNWESMDKSNASLDFAGENSSSTNISTGTDYYVQIRRTSDTAYDIKVYSDSSYSTLVDTITGTMSASSISGLRYIMFYNRNDHDTSYNQEGTIDDLSFYNGVTSIN